MKWYAQFAGMMVAAFVANLLLSSLVNHREIVSLHEAQTSILSLKSMVVSLMTNEAVLTARVAALEASLAAEESSSRLVLGHPTYDTADNYNSPNASAGDIGLTVRGKAVVYGTTTVYGCILFQVEGPPTRLVNSCKWWIDSQNMSGAVCDIETCEFGTRNILTCACMCDVGFSGDACDINDCNGRGTWLTEVNFCDCEDPWLVDGYCLYQPCSNGSKTSELACPDIDGSSTGCLSACEGTCVNGVCHCTQAGVLGANCDLACATTNMSNTDCPYRNNWGHDGCNTPKGGAQFCVCGGNYARETADVVHIKALICPTNDTGACRHAFLNYSHICCSPYFDCSTFPDTCGHADFVCCSAYTVEQGCLSAGCAWCDDGTSSTCGAIDLADLDNGCVQRAPYDIGEGHMWATYSFDCSVENATNICSRTTRSAYLGYYDDCDVVSPPTEACLAVARSKIHDAGWPRLSTDTQYDLGPQRISISGVQSIDFPDTMNTCPTPPAIAIDPKFLNTEGNQGALAVWVCQDRLSHDDQDVSKIYVKPAGGSADRTETGLSTYNVFIVDTRLNLWCLSDTPLTITQSIQLFNVANFSDQVNPAQPAFWWNLKVEASAYLETEGRCLGIDLISNAVQTLSVDTLDFLAVGSHATVVAAMPYSSSAIVTPAVWEPEGQSVTIADHQDIADFAWG